MNDLWNDISDRLNILDESIKNLRQSGREYAEAEAAYKAELSKQVLQLRKEGYPVTIIGDIVRGLEPVKESRLDRDAKKVLYQADLEVINVSKLRIKVLEAQLNREWRS